jgi:dihydrofolate reductase
MKKVILQEFVSVDGLASGPHDSVDFVPASNQGDQRFGQRQMEFLDSIDTILLGRVTYEMFAGHWPNVPPGPDRPFADKLNAIPKVVFSRTLNRAPWGSYPEARVVKTSPAKELAKLRQGSGKDMVIWGSISLAQSLMGEGVIDEYQLIVCPVVLGKGRPLFPEKKDSVTMKLLTTTAFDRGSVLLAYTAAPANAGASKTR